MGDIPGNDEIINNCHNGILFPKGDVQALSLSILKIISDKKLAKSLSENGKKNSKQKYNQDNMILKYEDYYHRI